MDIQNADLTDKDERQAYVKNVLSQASRFVDEQLSPDRAQATDYYLGRGFGNEEEGRSQVVSTEVRDAVQMVMPSLMKVFFGPERAVEFRPRGPEDVDYAEQATDFISEIVMKVDNNGFIQLHNAFKDALVRRMGIVKWWYDEKKVEETLELEGLTEEAVAQLASDPTISFESLELDEKTGLFEAEIHRSSDEGKIRFAAIPPEEFIFNSSARSIEDAIMVGHRCFMSMAELIEMGYDEEDIRESMHGGRSFPMNEEADARSLHDTVYFGQDEAEVGPHTPVLYVEAFFLLQDSKSKAIQIRRICTVGEGYKVVVDEPAYEKPFALFVPDIEPHTLEGLSLADRVMDIQKIKSMVLRGSLDSLALTLTPATEIVDGQVNMQDVLNPEMGKVVRVKAPGMMREIDHRFVGADAFPLLQYFDQMRERRIGVGEVNSPGLSADALQSTTKAAVQATVEASRQQLEMIARVFAETGMRDLMRGLLRMSIMYQQPGRIVRLRGKFVPIDPRVWDADMDVTVNVALGSALVEDKLNALMQIAAKQEQIIAQTGTQNPLVSVTQYRYTLGRMIELMGFKDTTRFFNEIDEEKLKEAEAMAAEQSQQQQPDPAMMLAQAEIAKSQNDVQVAQAKLQIEAKKADQDSKLKLAELEMQDAIAQQEHARAMQKIAAEIELKKLELELRYQQQVDDAQLRAETDVMRAHIQAEAQRTIRESATQKVGGDGSVTETTTVERPSE